MQYTTTQGNGKMMIHIILQYKVTLEPILIQHHIQTNAQYCTCNKVMERATYTSIHRMQNSSSTVTFLPPSPGIVLVQCSSPPPGEGISITVTLTRLVVYSVTVALQKKAPPHEPRIRLLKPVEPFQ